MKTRVVNLHREPYDVYIGRNSKWGNPFRIVEYGSREKVVKLYRDWIQTQPELLAAIPELTGKKLGCYCAPLACHGDVLVELVNVLTELMKGVPLHLLEEWLDQKENQ